MENFYETVGEIIFQLENIGYCGDMTDIGNEIGIAIGNKFDKDNTIEDFFSGLKHGISLADGTH
jgi:hypothetical protein